MATTGSLRFAFLNRIATALLKNGTASAPARDEVAPWLMENAQTKDRTFPWQQQSGGGFVDVDFDLTRAASNVSISLLAALGQRGVPNSSVGIVSITPSYSTHANGYPPVALSAWTNFPAGTLTMGSGVRDAVAVVAPVSCRYVRFEILAASTFSLGRFFAGGVDLDLGLIATAGGRERRLVKPMLANEVGSNPTKTRVGDNHYLYSVPIDTVLIDTITALRTLVGKDDPALMIDFDGAPYEVVIDDDSLLERLLFDAPDVYDAELKLRTLG